VQQRRDDDQPRQQCPMQAATLDVDAVRATVVDDQVPSLQVRQVRDAHEVVTAAVGERDRADWRISAVAAAGAHERVLPLYADTTHRGGAGRRAIAEHELQRPGFDAQPFAQQRDAIAQVFGDERRRRGGMDEPCRANLLATAGSSARQNAAAQQTQAMGDASLREPERRRDVTAQPRTFRRDGLAAAAAQRVDQAAQHESRAPRPQRDERERAQQPFLAQSARLS